MREILFRGKRVDNGEWVEGFYAVKGEAYRQPEQYCICVSTLSHDCESSYFTDVEVWPETVGQYTGLTDRNGKKIFEGDIVWGDDCSGTWHKGIVEYDDNLGCFIVNAQNFMQYPKNEDCYCLSGHWCVEGNIHDNEELLKEGAK